MPHADGEAGHKKREENKKQMKKKKKGLGVKGGGWGKREYMRCL